MMIERCRLVECVCVGRRRWPTCLGLCAWLVLVSGCASGYDDGTKPNAAVRNASGIRAGQGGSAPQAGSPGAPAGSGGSANAPYTGEPCEMGQTETCACEQAGTEGVRVCRFDRASPTDGTFSACENCMPLAPTMADEGDVMARAGSGGAGRGGSGSGGAGAGGRAGGSAGSTSGGESSGGDRPRGGSGCSSPCTNVCFPIGILPCCTLLGTCGCTWAPGAYCL